MMKFNTTTVSEYITEGTEKDLARLEAAIKDMRKTNNTDFNVWRNLKKRKLKKIKRKIEKWKK